MKSRADSTDPRPTAEALAELLRLEAFSSLEALQEDFSSRVREEVEPLVELMSAADAFDLIELMRLREVPISPILGVESQFDGSGAALEIVALILTCRTSRNATALDQPASAQPHELVPILHDAATRLIRLTTAFTMVSARFSKEPLAQLAAEYQANVQFVRTMQYPHLQDRQNADLLASERLRGVLESALGFSYDQFIQVRDAITSSLYSDRFIALRDETAGIVRKYGSLSRVPSEVERQFGDAITRMMFLPGERAQFTVADIAVFTDCQVDVVQRVFDVFSTDFIKRDPSDAVNAFLRGHNPFRTAGLVSDGAGNYLIAGNPIGTDNMRYVVEIALKNGRKWSAYNNARTAMSERNAIDEIECLLKSKVLYRGLKYFAPNDGIDADKLNVDCTNLTTVGKETECDGLFVIDDLAVCVEVKGRTITDAARRGDVRRLARELANIVGSAASQARRLEALIELNGGVWKADHTWLSLESVREIRSIAVCLDDIGPLAIAMDDLRRSNILDDGSLPWVTSLHDLSVIAQVVDRPAEFLLYLRRRTDSGAATLFRATDELDLFMLFLSSDHLYIEPNPDHVASDHPMAPVPTKGARRRFRRTQRPVRVLTHTDPLDAWLYKIDGSSPFPADKPTFTANSFTLNLVDKLTEERPPGWLRVTSDLLASSGESQANLENAVRSVVSSTQLDHQYHSATQAFAGVYGFPVIVVGSCPLGTPQEKAVDDLAAYAVVRKYQLKSDRAVAISFDEAGDEIGVTYHNDHVAEDPEMDELVRRLRLQPPRLQSTPHPNKRHKTKNRHGRKKKRHHR